MTPPTPATPTPHPAVPYDVPLTVPDPDALPDVQALCDIDDPWTAGPDADALFTRAMAQTDRWHAARSPFWAAVRDGHAGDVGAPTTSTGRPAAAGLTVPALPAAFLKRHEVVSVPPEDVALELTSSGTSGQKSHMLFDHWTIDVAQRMVARVFAAEGWVDTEHSVDYLLFSYEPARGFDVGTAFTDNYLCDFAPARHVTHALRRTGGTSPTHEADLSGCIAAVDRAARDGVPLRILGFPSFLVAMLDRMRATGHPPVDLPAGSLVFTGGGWKTHADREIPKDEFRRRVRDGLGIPEVRVRDSFGSVEHCVPVVECDHHRLHLTVWARAVARDVASLEALPHGGRGFLHLMSPYITSVPAHSVLMGDMASVHAGAECPCGVATDWFTLHGRAGVSRNRSCAVAAAEMLTSGKGAPA
ncbi:acyl-protein synthase [Corynebacterium bovis]|uniref:LuxE/PaaK family acyltransferase n=1 Tax=Corynebacterium bovis TaxID=36808 RepID=UPI00244C94DC|nr:acyl-protein synthase [Corynebacterium bovis]MDH2456095.1 acyl-protein synthase [Corynebacterium bovis]